MTVAVVGGGGFLGTNLVETLGDCRIIEKGDPLLFSGVDAVVHLAANADVRNGWADPTRDLESNVLLTSRVLEAMRLYDVPKLVFASSGSVYAPKTGPIPETDPVHATSLYAASKIAAEQLVAAYTTAGHFDATVLRFVSVLGPHYSHGLLCDFLAKLAETPDHLDVIGPGTSQKSYVHVSDVVRAIELVLPRRERFEILNVGTNETATPLDIASWITDAEVRIVGDTWVGDNPHILLNCSELRALGWAPEWTIREAVEDTTNWLGANHDTYRRIPARAR